MKSIVLFLVAVLSLVLLGAGTARAQQVEITAPPPERVPRPEFVLPGQPPDVTRPREQDFFPDHIRSRHDPAFLVPFTTTVSTGPQTATRFGLSLWTAPQGRGDFLMSREHGGWVSFGFSFVWDVPVEAGRPPATPR